MIVKEVYGDLFDIASIYNCDAIAHGCNVDGLMGAGVARLFKNKFPSNYELYKDMCLMAKRNSIEITGSYCGLLDINSGRAVYNLFTQDRPGPNARIEWVAESFEDVVSSEVFSPTKMCIPKIGCGIGGLEWEDVKTTLEEIDSTMELVVAYI